MKRITLITNLLLLLITSNIWAQISFKKINKLTTTSNFYAVQTADMNNDGLMDIIGATSYSWTSGAEDAKIFIYVQDTLGNLNKTATIDYPKNYPGLSSMAIGNLNDDSLKDIVISFPDSIGIFYQTSPNQYSQIEKYFCGGLTDRVMCRDIDNDSLDDIIVKNSDYNSRITVFKQKANNLEKTIYPSLKHYSYEQFEFGNFNKDKLTDILYYTTYDKSAEKLYVMLQDSLLGYPEDSFNLYFPDNDTYKENMKDFTIGDINNDSFDDVLGLNPFTDSIYIWKNDNYSFSKPIKIPTYEYGLRFKVIDLNCDCNNDILVIGDVAVAAHESRDEFQSFTTSYIQNQYASPSVWYNQSATGDLNNDGKTDVAIAFLDGIVILENTSKPIKFSKIDTIPRYDTLAHDINIDRYKYFRRTLIDSVENYVVHRIDSFNIVSRYEFTAYNLDTMFIRKAIFCNKDYIDSVYTEKANIYFDNLKADTTLFYSKYDTLKTAISITEIKKAELKIFPNPTNSKLNVSVPLDGNSQCLVEIISSEGKKVFSDQIHPIKNQSVTVDIDFLKPGIYFLKIEQSGKTRIGKFVRN